eukprot:TRINITY_DN19972_c0_g1_i2.p1 TRINITY_DN19972_c0_g1~~TRINITY_DN19972_c0_g1_i2.p1  ORF type:complete len:127 (+),score=16.79 TRINITY_DN19972_c0_g1_i2:212-592(+)
MACNLFRQSFISLGQQGSVPSSPQCQSCTRMATWSNSALHTSLWAAALSVLLRNKIKSPGRNRDSMGSYEASPHESSCCGLPQQPPMAQVQTSPYSALIPVSYTHLRAHETPEHLVCRLLLEKKKK